MIQHAPERMFPPESLRCVPDSHESPESNHGRFDAVKGEVDLAPAATTVGRAATARGVGAVAVAAAGVS
jgi:hypothetical protein